MEENGTTGPGSNPMEQDPAKIFIGGLHSQTDGESLRCYFEKYGEIKDCTVMRDAVTKRSRGFGFVIFKDALAVDKVLDKVNSDNQYHVIDGKKVEAKRAIPKKPPPSQNQNFKKVFVGGLPPDITSQELTEYFETFGKVNEVLLMQDKATKRLRGFGFVVFESETAGKNVCDAGYHKIKGKNVECKKAQPKEAMMLQVNLAPYPFNRNFPNGMTSPVAFGIPDWNPSPQLYQQLVNWMALGGRGKTYATTGTGHNYVTAPQGFGNMPDHRRHQSGQQYFTEYQNVNTTTASATTETLSPQSQDYELPAMSVQMPQYVTPSSTVVPTASQLTQGLNQATTRPPPPDMANFLANRNGFANEQPQIYHGTQAIQSSQAAFGHSLPPITLRH